MSYKNTLQEYCQANKLQLPTYKTERLESKDHHPRFVSNVSIILPNNTRLAANGKVRTKKKAAEISAAEHLLNNLNQHLDDTRITFDTEQKTRILIDLENVSLNDFLEKYSFTNQYVFEGFATSNSSCLTKLSKYSDKMIFHTVKSTRRDAADILMVLYVSSLIPSDEKINLIVVTNDHFGHSLMDCLDSLDPKNFHSFKSVNSLDELVDVLQGI